MSQFDWVVLMRAGLCGLRLPPDTFWALTPAELRVMLGSESAAFPLNRSGLDALLRAYPDKIGGTKDESD